MSPNEHIPIKEAFAAAASKLGWISRDIEQFHERDCDCSSMDTIWFNANGARLFSLREIPVNLAREIVVLAER